MRSNKTMRKALILIIILLMASNTNVMTGHSFAAGANVPDPSFENGTGWAMYGMSRSTDKAHTGSYAVKTTTVGAVSISGEFPIESDTSYKLSGWIYKETGSGTAYLDLNDIAGEVEPSVNAGGKWTKVSADWFSGTRTSLQIRLVTAAGIDAPVYFDDVELTVNAPDSTFETEAGWSFGSLSRSRDKAKTGNYSLKSTINGASARTNVFEVAANTTYKLSGWIYKTNNAGNVYLDLNDIPGEIQPGVYDGSGGGVWTYVSGIWNSGANTEVRLRTITDNGLNAAAYFDDVKLEVVQPDGTFESDAGWTYGSMSRSTDQAKTGTTSLKSSANGIAATSNPISVLPDTKYKLSGWIYKNNNAGNAYLDLNDITGEPQPGVFNGAGEGAWTYVSGLWDSGNATQARVRTITDGGLSASAYFDDVKLEPVAPDGSFESTDGWLSYGAMTRSTDRSQSGTYSLKSTSNGAVAYSNTLPVEPNTRYTLSAWIYKTDNNGDAYLDLNDVDKEVSPGVIGGLGAGTWTKVSRDWFSGDQTSVRVRAVTDNGITGAVYFDNVSFTPAGTTLEANPQIISTIYPTEDVVVADFNVTDFGADATGAADSTMAIQNAMDNAQHKGGGTVWMPAGTYKVSNTLHVPSGVFLRGDWRDPDSGSGDYGTVIEAHVNAGFQTLFTMLGDVGGLYGLTIYYPNQNAANPIDTGWVVTSDVGHNRFIKNLTLLNAYSGFRFGMSGTGGFTACPEISYVKGTVLSRGLELFNGYGAGGAHHITFNNSYWADAGTAYHAPLKSTLDAWTRANGTAFTFGRIEIYNFHHLSAEAYNIGMRFGGGNTAGGVGTWGSNLAFVSLTNTNTALQVDDASVGRFNAFIRSTLEGSLYSIKNNVTNHTIKVTDTTLTGATSGSVSIASPGTSPTAYTTRDLPKITRAVLYDVTKAPYNAPRVSSLVSPTGFPFDDATSAIQSALTDAGNAGGGIVYLPAGWYRINGNLSIPTNVELRGTGSGKTGAYISYGTWLTVYGGENTSTPQSDTAAVTLNGDGSGINAINVIWPNNPFEAEGTLKTYPFAFRINAKDAYVIYTNFKNPYHGIDVANGSDRHLIRSVYGSYSNTFIRVGTSTEGWIEELYDMNPSPWTGISEFKMKIPWMAPGTLLINYQKMQKFIELNGPSNEHIMSILAYAPGTLVHVTSGNADIWNVGADQSGEWCVNAVGGTVKIMNSVNTVHGTNVNTGSGIVESYNEHYVIL